MAEFNIYKPDGTVLCKGTPVYNGAYMKPSSLTFRSISSPTPIDWSVGCRVNYPRFNDPVEYSHPSQYFLYSLPQVKKRARQHKIGDSFVYENVTFYDESKLLEFSPFRDLVTADNQVHFSSRPSFSTYEAVDGIARRLEACLNAQYPDKNFSVMVATTAMGASQETVDLMAEPREFSVNLVSCMGVLDQIYQVWPGIGWVFQLMEEGYALRILIGGGGIIGTQQNYMYGKGYGLKELTRTLVNDSEIVNRIYPFGNTTNMPLRYYNGLDIKNAESVDIPNLMIPVADWGTTEVQGTPKPDASKAFLGDVTSQAKIGLRPKLVYFDGSDNLDDIYPTIKGIYVDDLMRYDADNPGKVDFPPDPDYPEITPLNEIQGVQPDPTDSSITDFDTGVVGEDGRATLFRKTVPIDDTSSKTIPSPSVGDSGELIYKSITPNVWPSNEYDDATFLGSLKDAVIKITPDSGVQITSVSIGFWTFWRDRLGVSHSESNGYIDLITDAELSSVDIKQDIADRPITMGSVDDYAITNWIWVKVGYRITAAGGDKDVVLDVVGNACFDLVTDVTKNFQVTIPPFGYDITNLPSDGDRTIRMTSGMCAGREFAIRACSFNSDNELILTLERFFDESLSQYFPNYDYPVAADDTFVLLGIQMPEFYITAAASRLKTAAQDYLALYKKEIWQYNPTMDDKFMLESGRIIIPGQMMTLIDPNIIEGDTPTSIDGNEYFNAHDGKFFTSQGERILLAGSGYPVSSLVDAVTVDEGAVIPAWKVTLRDRKKTKTGF